MPDDNSEFVIGELLAPVGTHLGHADGTQITIARKELESDRSIVWNDTLLRADGALASKPGCVRLVVADPIAH